MMLFNTVLNAVSGSNRVASAPSGFFRHDGERLASCVAARVRASLQSKRRLLLAGFLGLCALAPSGAYAQNNITAQMIVSMDIIDGCTINGSQNPVTSLNFGTVQNAQAQTQPILASTDLTIACNVSSTVAAILIDGGQNFDGTVRRMSNAAVAGPIGEFITYRLYEDAARTIEFDPNTKTAAFTLTAGAPTIRTVYGAVLASDVNGKSSSPYTDVTNVEVSF